MSGIGRKITAVAVAVSLCAVPTAAIGAARSAPVAAAQPVAAPAGNPWLELSAMTTSSSAVSAAAADQYDRDRPGFPPIAPLVVILATIAVAIWILVHDDHDKLDHPISVG